MDPRILIIDDNEDDLILATRYLTRAGYKRIATVTDAAEGVKRAIAEKPDVVISDTVLPGSSGFEVCRQIREVCGPTEPKIVIITGSIDAVDAVKARTMGANDYCAKASDCGPLLEAMQKLTISE